MSLGYLTAIQGKPYAKVYRPVLIIEQLLILETRRTLKMQWKVLNGIFALFCGLLAIACCAYAQTKSYPRALVSFSDFKNLVADVESQRESRLVDFDTFLAMSKEPGTIILDSRSDFRFERVHLKGAKHLSFTDFTQSNLAKVIPSSQTKILIYCNNNFKGNQVDFASKRFSPVARDAQGNLLVSQFASQKRPIMLALNVPTYINLYGYGYHNVYELDELVNVRDPRVAFEGTVANN
jgi:hypothetical protein